MFNDDSLFKRILFNHELDAELQEKKTQAAALQLAEHQAQNSAKLADASKRERERQQENSDFSKSREIAQLQSTARTASFGHEQAIRDLKKKELAYRSVAAELIMSNQSLLKTVLFLAEKWPMAYDSLEEEYSRRLLERTPEVNEKEAFKAANEKEAAFDTAQELAKKREKEDKITFLLTEYSEKQRFKNSKVLPETQIKIPKRSKSPPKASS
jgi:hypothetical protein